MNRFNTDSEGCSTLIRRSQSAARPSSLSSSPSKRSSRKEISVRSHRSRSHNHHVADSGESRTEEWNRSGSRAQKRRLCVVEVYSDAEYSCIVTENGNQPSIKLFIDKCGDSKFCTSSILVHPVFTNRVWLSNRVAILKLAPSDAKSLYCRQFSTTEFFPRDIDSVLNNKLNLGTFITIPYGSYSWPGLDRFLANSLKYV